jgi:hypothetical protein
MRYTLALILSVISIEFAMAKDYTHEIEQAQRSCKNEQMSLLSSRNGTPSCQRVQNLIELQRLQTEASVSRQTGQPMPNHYTTQIYNQNPRYSGGSAVNSSPRRIYDPQLNR